MIKNANSAPKREIADMRIILTKLSSVVKANTEIMITDSDGKQVLSYTSPKDLSALIFSSSDITKGDTYTIQAGSLSIQVKAE